LLLAVGIDASAQEFTGSIYGRIVDPSNAPMSGVAITVEGAAIQGKRTAESEDNGSYRLLNLPPGEYRVTFEKAKFKTVVYESAKVEVNKTLTMNVTMQIADVAATVVVSANAPVVDVRSATVGTTFGASFLNDIPNQRDLFALLAASPGISLPRVDFGGNTAGTPSAFRAYGLAGQTITTVDGVNITVGSAAIGAYVDYGAMAEAQVSAAGNGADVAVAGAAVTTVVKSGSNTHHGEFFTDFKPSGGEGYSGAEEFLRYLDINGQLGGPLIKDRLWYFLSLRGQQTSSLTGMYDKPPAQGGTQGHLFTTGTTDYTLKLNYQLDRNSTLTFMTQWGRKVQPYRGGSGAAAANYTVESTASQNSRTEIGNVVYTRVINNRAMLDTSLNVFGSQFPLAARTDKTPIIDDVTFFRSGAYNAPSYTEDRRWHYNTNLNLYADHHDMKIGYMYQWYAPQFTAYGAPGPAGTVGHVYVGTTQGVPTSFFTDNGPVSSVDTLQNHALFFQDKFQVTSKLTLNYGVRFDQYRSSYPEQRFGVSGNGPCVDEESCDLGPFAVRTVTPARNVVTFNMLVPRIAVIYDLSGNGKTAVKTSWNRYATNPAETISDLVNPIDLITTKYAWDNNYLTMDPGVGATRITPAYVATLQPILGGAQLTPAEVDPKLKDSYTDEYTLGIEREVVEGLRVYGVFVRKVQKNLYGRYDRLRSFSAYTPVSALDPGPDGIINTADDRTITVWETTVPPGTTDYYLTNKPIGDDYSTVEFGATKRMGGHWQLTSGFDWTKRNLSSLFSEDPNTVFWNNNDTQTSGWTLKASGSYLFKRGWMVAFWYNAMRGEPYGRVFTVTQQYLDAGRSESDDSAGSGQHDHPGREGRDVLSARHQCVKRARAEGIRAQRLPEGSCDAQPLQHHRRQDRDRRQHAHRRAASAVDLPGRYRRPFYLTLHLLTMKARLRSSSFGGQAPQASSRNSGGQAVWTTVVLLFVSALVCAQRFKSEVLLINVVATVVDGKGRTIPNLTADDFVIEEDGQPQAIKLLLPSADLPISVGVLLDASKSMETKIRTAQRAVDRFLSKIHKDDEIFVMTFALRPSVIADFTSDRTTLRTALLSGVNLAGGTSLYDSLYQGLQKVQQGRYDKKAVLLVTDGEDTTSMTRFDKALQYIREAEMLVYSIGIKGAPALRHGN
jgi:hypothetical protein